MILGLILECGPVGADKKVCEHLVKRLIPDVTIKTVTLDNKKNLTNNCGPAAARLIENDKCEKVIIVWDLYPTWRDTQPCMKQDRDEIFRSLDASGVDRTKIALVCVVEELEAWLLADHRALEDALSRPTRPAKIKRIRKTEEISNPKKYIGRLYREHGRTYNDLIDAEKIVKAMPDLDRIADCDTFQRFRAKVEGK